MVGHAVVDDALADDGALLFAVEGSRVVLIIHDVKLRILGGENFFGFSFVKLFPFFHVHRLPLYSYLFDAVNLSRLCAEGFGELSVLLLDTAGHIGLFIQQFLLQRPVERARICAARRAAFSAPSIATVATGMPDGICTVDSRASSPSRVEDFTGMPMTGRMVWAASTPARCAALPRGGDNDAEAVLRRPRGECHRLFRGPVGAHHMCLHRDAERFQGVDGFPHDRKVAVTAHDDRHFLEFSVIAFVLSSQSGTKKTGCGTPAPQPAHPARFPRTRALDATASSIFPQARRMSTTSLHILLSLYCKTPKIARCIPAPRKICGVGRRKRSGHRGFCLFCGSLQASKKFRIFSLGFTPSIVYNVV